ncbi:MAG: hypothetical protein Fur009_0430 [Candidatus Microgenomates bacterium]
MDNIYFIIDFDSTFIKSEALEELAKIALKNTSEEKIIKKIQEITRLGMEGKIPFNQSLKERIKLFKATKTDLEKLIKILKKSISPSILRNKNFFKKNKDKIYIISGGFKEYILPIVKSFGISEDHILANKFIFNKDQIVGFDEKNLLSQENGKVKQIKALNLKGKIYIIGDGYTDYQIKKQGLAEKFFLFCENVKRNSLLNLADYILPNFDEFLYLLNLPRAFSYPKNRIKVLLLENINNEAVKLFEKEGYQIDYYSSSLEKEKLIEKIKDISILGIRSKTYVDENILLQAKKLLTIGAFCIGINQINLKEANKQGIAVFNDPYSNSRSVAELVIGEIIVLFRKIFYKSQKLHQGIWDKSANDCYEIKGKKLGIIGYGNIGTQVSVLAESLGMEVYFYDIVEKLPLGNAKKCQTLKELLKIADVVTVHIDGRKNNYNLIGEKEFSLMKDGVIFLNLSRGFVVNINALVKYIKNGKIKGAAIDVFPNEPLKSQDKFKIELQNLPNVILTPHIGGSTEEAQRKIGLFVAKKIIEYINTGNSMLSVNFPNLNLPPQKKLIVLFIFIKTFLEF